MTGVALIGLGMVAPIYVDALAGLPDITLIGVLSRSEDSRRTFLAKHGLAAKSYASVAEIAADEAVDFVIVTTPPNARAEIVDVLVKAGKPILMEKPVERTLDAATALVETCEAAGVPLGIVLQHRARPALRKFHNLDLGPLHAVEVHVPWWRPQSYYNELGRGTYARDGGGVLISQAIHPIDLMLSIAGPVAEVQALVATTGLHKMESEDFVSAGLHFANGAVGALFATTAGFPGRGESLTFHYEKGSAHFVRAELTITHRDGREEQFGSFETTGAGADPMAFTSEWHRTMIADFAEALRDGRPPMVPGREALGVHRLITAIEASGRSGKVEQV